MTILTIMRHAKSGTAAPGGDDFERRLTDRGRETALQVGRELRHRDVNFDLVLASPAARVRETLDGLAEGYAKPLDVHFEPAIYEAGVPRLFELVRRIPERVCSALLVGHNPGLQHLVETLARDDSRGMRGRVREEFPTAAVAVIELPSPRWAETASESGEIVELIFPRGLD